MAFSFGPGLAISSGLFGAILGEPEYRRGESQCALSREYGISRYAIQSWLKEPVLPKVRGRKPAKTLSEYKHENKRLKMENELLRDFLHSTGRK